MSDVPKIVRQHAAQQPAGEHPDANLLAAFTEGGLTQGERAQVLAHLGTCAACRDVIALALPESAAPVPAAAQPATSWLRWPVLRWAGAAAAVVVVAAAVMLMKPHQQVSTPTKQTEVAVSPDKTATKPAETPSAPAPRDKLSRKDSAPVTAARQEPKSNGLKKEDGSGAHKSTDAFAVQALKDSPAARDLDRMAKKNEAAQLQAPEKRAAAQSQTPAVPANAPSVPVQSAKAQFAPQTSKAQTPVSAASPTVATGAGVGGGVGTGAGGGVGAGVAGGVVGGPSKSVAAARAAESQARTNNEAMPRDEQAQVVARERTMQQMRPVPQAAESVEVTGAPAVAAEKAGREPMTNVMMRPVAPRWRVSATGELERSADGGANWETVRVAATPVSFRSVSTVNHDIWAGGTGGALYHSADDGRTWTRVTVKALDMVLATDIARVEFTDARHGTVTTADGVRWITNDAGATWSLATTLPR